MSLRLGIKVSTYPPTVFQRNKHLIRIPIGDCRTEVVQHILQADWNIGACHICSRVNKRVAGGAGNTIRGWSSHERSREDSGGEESTELHFFGSDGIKYYVNKICNE